MESFDADFAISWIGHKMAWLSRVSDRFFVVCHGVPSTLLLHMWMDLGGLAVKYPFEALPHQHSDAT
jgi:hypothetical protein